MRLQVLELDVDGNVRLDKVQRLWRVFALSFGGKRACLQLPLSELSQQRKLSSNSGPPWRSNTRLAEVVTFGSDPHQDRAP